MNLYFLRHGLAGQHPDALYKNDSLRPLTEEGKEKMHGEMLGMQALGLTFDAILSSPYVRARQTAEIVAQGYKIKKEKIHLTNNLLAPASIENLLDEIHARLPKSKNILLVGHQPHLTELISSLLKSKIHLSIDLKKGALCCLKIPAALGPSGAVLNWLLTPKQLNALKPEL